MLKNILGYFDFGYYLRFAGLFFLFYLTYTFVNAASAPTGTYYPFVEKYLNFPVLIRFSILNIAHSLLALLGYGTAIVDDKIMSNDGTSILQMAWPCYGLGLKSFWIAFVCAHKMAPKQKIYWSAIGVVTIFLLNCIRVIVILISMVDNWKIAGYLGTNAHDLFNYLCYAALLGLIMLFYAKSKSKHSIPPVQSAHA